MEYHICFGSDGDLRVSEIWDSREKGKAYGELLMPILVAAGIQLSGEPEVFEVHNIIKRQPPAFRPRWHLVTLLRWVV